ncbi:MAG: site-specific DNA-methyltransferase [Melioribacteraceae bacterium]|nr:site-specific DNA-methyltransferase [Melioribacteraceae bacterium]MCF8355315.1 site-specific DNA-methyltransferase [Melioribacteraceae bacterium]MCF8395700.1 site-specific DNA-methyltransferase [Melioribacteraceae bacterium]MCF8420393.1 site-specific DNA-methyltransferase [Melioribacteraceae bacterium]
MNRSKKNKTLSLSQSEIDRYSKKLIKLKRKSSVDRITNKTINQDLFSVIEKLPEKFIDLLIVDPPYNRYKLFNEHRHKLMPINEYAEWIDSFLSKLVPCLKDTSSIYFCGDWLTSTSIHLILNKYFTVRNRITWEREKGRGANSNWKSNSEDIWFCTVSNNYTFNTANVKLKRRVLAPYKDKSGIPKDWKKTKNGNYRLTFPSNIWNDITIPFWSMPENTEHPTQKPEKLIAKIILASSNEGDLVFDPFLGSGTTSVVAKKLNRKYSGVEIDKKYACIAEKRLESAKKDNRIQGYSDGIFWERNTSGEQA